MKNYIPAIVIVGILLVVGITCLIIKKNIDKNIMDGPGMINEKAELYDLIAKEVKHGEYLKIKYSSSGDMNGNIDTMELDVKAGTLKTQYVAMHSDPIEVNEYRINQEDIEKLISMIEKYNLVAWSTLPDDETMFALDGPTRVLEVECAGIKENSISDYYNIYAHAKFPEGGWEIYLDIVKELADLVNKGEKTNTYIKNEM